MKLKPLLTILLLKLLEITLVKNRESLLITKNINAIFGDQPNLKYQRFVLNNHLLEKLGINHIMRTYSYIINFNLETFF